MRAYILILVLIIAFSCNSNKRERNSIVIIDGEKVEMNSSYDFDSNEVNSIINDTSYIHNKRIEGMEGEGIIDCNLDFIYWIDSIRGNRLINEKDIYTFFISIEPECKYHEGYKSDISKCIWTCFGENPSDFLFALSKIRAKDKKEYIMQEIKYPSIDPIKVDLNLSEIKKKRNIDTSLINEIIKANSVKIEK